MYSELKILFIHGLEAGPFGKKYQMLGQMTQERMKKRTM